MTSENASLAAAATDWAGLLELLERANGPDTAVDAALVRLGGGGSLTASAEAARVWATTLLPGWHAHVGFDVSGVLPYAAFSREGCHVEATAPTVPLAILRAAVRALAGDQPASSASKASASSTD
ncbi:MAG: hypothetical protein NVV74_19325 [Magnetospirillum sp.]|nr:hypothetical protein [Magnetospirillum sp.]